MATSHDRLIWELLWLPCEIAMAVLAFILLFAVQFVEAGVVVLFLTVVISLTVRLVHYSAIKQVPSEASARVSHL